MLYASYNSLLFVPMLINLKKYNLNKRKIFILSLLTMIVLGSLMFVIYKTNNYFYPEIMSVEMPNMMLAAMLSTKMKVAYGIVIIVAIFTTAFSSGFNFLQMCSNKNYEKNALLLCVVAFLCSKIGFSTMINIFFPLFGYLGFFQIFLIIKCLKSREVKK